MGKTRTKRGRRSRLLVRLLLSITLRVYLRDLPAIGLPFLRLFHPKYNLFRSELSLPLYIL